MRATTGALRLPLRGGHWRGSGGTVLGQGTGSSIDFQDQRAYVPGDDPRHINWQATARTGNTTMKLFRQEVTPRVDLLLDLSSSMFLTPAKSQRTWELIYFCIESSLRLGGTLRLHHLGAFPTDLPLQNALAYSWPEPPSPALDLPSALSNTPLRQGSLRILISDLLSPSPPETALPLLTAAQGRTLILAPATLDEAEPDWDGNIDFEDCESTKRSRRRVTPELKSRYHRAYHTHFQLWREQAARHRTLFARIPAEPAFLDAMQSEALPSGAIELA
jgi:uncharacterized protein (DUF58 family)